jgi:hypothetical protein
MINLDNCPCCKNAWTHSGQSPGYPYDYCDKCMIYYYNTHKFLVRLDVLEGKGSRLSWNFKTNSCEYGYNGFILPWLDFNITPEKLKLYLLFS